LLRGKQPFIRFDLTHKYTFQVATKKLTLKRSCKESPGHGSGSSRLRTFLSFVDEKEEIVKSRVKRKKIEGMSYRSTREVG